MKAFVADSRVGTAAHTQPQRIDPGLIAGYREMLQNWRYPHEVRGEEIRQISYASMAEPLVTAVSTRDAVRTLIVATVAPDWHYTAQPAVGLLPAVQHADAAKVSAWSLTDKGLLTPFLAIRLAALRMSRTGGDAIIVAADRVGTPYPVPELSEQRRVDADRVVCLRLSGDDGESLRVWESGDRRELSERLADAGGRGADRIVIGGAMEPLQASAAASGAPVIVVGPGQPATGVLSAAVAKPGRTVCGVWDDVLARGCVVEITVR